MYSESKEAAYWRDLEGMLSLPGREILFYIRRHMRRWVDDVSSTVGLSQREIYNRAVMLAGHRQLAAKHGLDVQLQSGMFMRPLPKEDGPFIRHDGDDRRRAELTFTNTKWLQWLEAERGMTTETTVHDGLRILGALAARESTRLVIPALGDTQSLVFSMDLSGAPQLIDTRIQISGQ